MFNNKLQAQLTIGIFADCQYCDCETTDNRYFRNSITKLTNCITEFNKTEDIDFVVGLGDLIDRNFSSFAKVNSILEKSKKEVFQVTGNHDLLVENDFIDKVPKQLNLSKTYYTFNKKGWQFIFLDGNEITLQSTNPKIVEQAKEMIKQLTADNKPNHHDWNGGMSGQQINWLKKQLKKAEKKKQKVILFCHYPLLPIKAHSLWNVENFLPILNKYNCVKAWINGHYHSGNYTIQNGIHYINFIGMVDTENENAFAVVTLSNDKIEINGFGREISRSLPIK